MGTSRAGQQAVGGGSRLLRCLDEWVAITLSRGVDTDSLDALLESDEPIGDPWLRLERSLAAMHAGDIVERAQLLGIPASVLGSVTSGSTEVSKPWPSRGPRDMSELVVVDLSAMWAGPLCGQLLQSLGATVIKVESPHRPDGARAGHPDFFAWMNGRKLFYSSEIDHRAAGLAGLLDVADVVIEASRPRALEQAGLAAHTRAPRAGRAWVRITGYGSATDVSNRVAFGDDAAVAGGLVGQGARGPVFCGDAIADPLTGLEAAHAVVASLGRGGGELIDVAMAGVAAEYAKVPVLDDVDPLGDGEIQIAAPRAPRFPEPVFESVDDKWVIDLVEKRRGPGC
ncbi:CoA transferase [Williamsia sp. R60]